MVSTRESFLNDLVVLLDRYDADFYYTSDADGVHFTMEGKDATPGLFGRESLQEFIDSLD